MKINLRVLLMIFALGVLLTPATITFADAPGKHPHYLHALADLRYARAHLDKLGSDDSVDKDSLEAIKQIDGAIADIKAASIDDGKDLNDHPSIDVHLKHVDRFHKALELLQQAQRDVNREEDDPAAQGLKHRSLQHIEDARICVGRAVAAALR